MPRLFIYIQQYSQKIIKDKNIETTTVLKLLNSYAESYKLLENENKSLKHYISDLKTNLKVSKQIIDSFISKNSENKYKKIISNLQNENKMNSKTNEELTKKNFTLEKTINNLKQINDDYEATFHFQLLDLSNKYYQ